MYCIGIATHILDHYLRSQQIIPQVCSETQALTNTNFSIKKILFCSCPTKCIEEYVLLGRASFPHILSVWKLPLVCFKSRMDKEIPNQKCLN